MVNAPDDDAFVGLEVEGACAHHPALSCCGSQLEKTLLWPRGEKRTMCVCGGGGVGGCESEGGLERDG